jgi:hypothetical protein
VSFLFDDEWLRWHSAKASANDPAHMVPGAGSVKGRIDELSMSALRQSNAPADTPVGSRKTLLHCC